jgi:aldose 1-epimerase
MPAHCVGPRRLSWRKADDGGVIGVPEVHGREMSIENESGYHGRGHRRVSWSRPMTRYAIRHEHLGPWPVVALTDSESGMSVRLARRGATLLDFHVPLGGRLRNIADGYDDADALEALDGARFAVMLPFANRVADARYRFDGKAYDLQPGLEDDARGIMHGFVRDADFELLSVDADDDSACVRFGHDGVRPGVHPGYPFALDLEVLFTLHVGGLDVEARMRNVGEQAAPCFFGWHPYLRLREDGIADCELQLPARQVIRTDDRLIPLPGASALQALERVPSLDFRHPRRIGGVVMDTGFADPQSDADGRIRTRLRDPDSGLAVVVWQRSGVTLAFTGDTLAGAAARRSIALEPMEAMTDAFNRDECVDAITLAAGAERRFRCGLEIQLP